MISYRHLFIVGKLVMTLFLCGII